MLATQFVLLGAVLSGAPVVDRDANSSGMQLIEFTASWCGACQQVRPAVERLEGDGIPIRVIDIDHQREVATRMRIEGIPCFVIVADGREIDRRTGPSSYDELRSWYLRTADLPDLSGMYESGGGAVVRGQTPRPFSRVRQALGSLAGRRQACPSPGTCPDHGQCDGTCGIAPPTGISNSVSLVPSIPMGGQILPTSTPPSSAPAIGQGAPRTQSNVGEGANQSDVVARAFAATVRLRVDDESGHSMGTGTIVDVHNDEALVLTCGHIFRASNGKGKIHCDSFAPNGPRDVEGTVVSWDMRRDVGLISFRPGVPVRPAKVAGVGSVVRANHAVFSIGCNQGDDPTVIHSKVIEVNRYHGPANLVVSGRPVNGRSGGGLFDAEGQLIGVCNAADQEWDEGLYAALGPIHAELDAAGLAFVYRRQTPELASRGGDDRAGQSERPAPRRGDAAPASVPTIPVKTPMPQEMPESDAIAPPQARLLPNQNAGDRDEGASSAQGDTEVICILRSRSRPQTDSQVFVLEQPSSGFLTELSQELNRRGPHVNTTSHIPDFNGRAGEMNFAEDAMWSKSVR
ncbi:MAG: trypsin-like peptidase domain-containing protein [Pirellulaceae bacterium]